MSISKEILKFDKAHPQHPYLNYGTKGFGYFFQYGDYQDPFDNTKAVRMGANNCRKCREEFFCYRDPKNYKIGFSSESPIDLEKLNRFWSMVEKKVGAGVETTWHPTDFASSVVVADMSPFWFKDITAFHMMTLLLRLFCIHHKGDLYKALKSYSLAWGIRKAVSRYMKGFTQPTYTDAQMQNGGQSNGIYSFFYGKDGFAIRKLLVKPSVLIPDDKTKAKA